MLCVSVRSLRPTHCLTVWLTDRLRRLAAPCGLDWARLGSTGWLWLQPIVGCSRLVAPVCLPVCLSLAVRSGLWALRTSSDRSTEWPRPTADLGGREGPTATSEPTGLRLTDRQSEPMSATRIERTRPLPLQPRSWAQADASCESRNGQRTAWSRCSAVADRSSQLAAAAAATDTNSDSDLTAQSTLRSPAPRHRTALAHTAHAAIGAVTLAAPAALRLLPPLSA